MGDKKAKAKNPNARKFPPKAGPNSNANRSSTAPKTKPETFTEGLAADRAARQTKRPIVERVVSKPFKTRFIERVGSNIVADAAKFNWSLQTRQLVHAYIKSLFKGDGSVPDGLHGRPVTQVQKRVAMTWTRMNPHAGSFPIIEKQPWLPGALQRERDIDASHRLARASQTTAA